MARRHQAGELFVGAATEELHIPDVELAGEPPDRRFRVPRTDDLDADAVVVLLEEVRGAHHVLEPVQRDEARVHEHPKHGIVGTRPGLDHVVVGADPDAPQSTPGNANRVGEESRMRVGIEDRPSRKTARDAVLQPVPLCRDAVGSHVTAVLGTLGQRDERIEQDRSPPAGTAEARHRHVGMPGKADQHHIGIGRDAACAGDAARGEVKRPATLTLRTLAPARRSALAMIRLREYWGSNWPKCTTFTPSRTPWRAGSHGLTGQPWARSARGVDAPSGSARSAAAFRVP